MRIYLRFLLPLAIVLAVLAPTGTAAATPTTPARPAAQAWSGPCHAAIDTYWPAAWRSWAHSVSHRESRGIPTSANARSSARGCFQMLLRYSAPFYRAVGCTNAQWANAVCNVRAALVMRIKHGTRPWALPTRRR